MALVPTYCALHSPCILLLHAELQDDLVFSQLPAILRTSVAHELTDGLLQQSRIFGPLRPHARR